MRQIHKGGEKTFVDYAGMKVPWIEPATGEIHEAEIFVGCLGASQFTFIEATATQQLPDWIQSHVRMWEYFGGVSEVVVPDNLRAAVTTKALCESRYRYCLSQQLFSPKYVSPLQACVTYLAIIK